jgi:hypothetical protein
MTATDPTMTAIIDAVTRGRAGDGDGARIALADNYRRLVSFDAARQQVDAARRHLHALPNDTYGAMIGTGLDEVEASISRGTTARRKSAPTGRPVDAASTT